MEYSELGSKWRSAGLVFDSGVRAGGGRYKWTYLGLAPKRLPSVAVHDPLKVLHVA